MLSKKDAPPGDHPGAGPKKHEHSSSIHHSDALSSIVDACCSRFNGTRPEPAGTGTVKQILDEIRTGKYRKQIEQIRAAEGDKEKQARLKRALPAVTFGCTLHYRALRENPDNPKSGPQNLISPTGLFVADMDHVQNRAAVKHAMTADANVLFAFDSPTDGLKVGLIIPGIQTPADYAAAYPAVERYFSEAYDLAIDPACKNLDRLCFLSWDRELLVNADPVEFDVQAWKQPKRQEPPQPPQHDNTARGKENFAQKVREGSCRRIRESAPSTQHVTRRSEGRLLGGYIASGLLDEAETLFEVEQAVLASGAKNIPASMKTVRDGINYGKAAPLEPPERPAPATEPPPEQAIDIWDNPADITSLINVEPDPLKWFVQDRILMGRGIVITGVGGSSKTRLLYHLGAGAVIGRLPWDWEISTKGRSVLVLTEDVFEDLHRTIHNLCLSLDISLEETQRIYDSIIAYPLAGNDIKLLSKTKSGSVGKNDLFHSLANKIKSLGDIAFIGLDPALSLTDGDELDQGHQRALGKMADDLAVQTGAVCALVTHATKGSLSKDELTSHNSRGGGAITDAVRAEYVMRTMTGKEAVDAQIKDREERFRHVQLVGTKGNYLPPSAYIPTWLRRNEYGMLGQADITMHSNAEPTKKEMECLEVLKAISETQEVSLKEWRDRLVELSFIREGTSESQKKTLDRIRKKLHDCGYIQKGQRRGFWKVSHEDEFLDFN